MLTLRHIFLLICLLAAGTAFADDETPQEQIARAAATDAGSSWIFGAGLAVSDPGYVGGKKQVTPFPLVFYHNGRFFFAGVIAGYMLSNGEHYRFSLTALPVFNRLSADDAPELAGIQDRRWSIAGGVNLDLFGDWGRFNAGVFHDLLGRNDGAGVNLAYQRPFRTGGVTFTPGVGVLWGSAALNDYYYGVSPAEARPGRPAYSPGSAASPYVSLGFSTPLSEHWQFRSDLRYLHFASAIHDSPIVGRSGATTLFIGFVYNPGGQRYAER
jgi:outer membrane protein